MTRVRIEIALLLTFLTPVLGNADDVVASHPLPEAAAMFERLVTRIPPTVDMNEVNEHVGMKFNFAYFNQSGSTEADLYMVSFAPFLVAGKQYCIHQKQRIHSRAIDILGNPEPPILTVVEIMRPSRFKTPVTEIGIRLLEETPALRKQPGAVDALDFHAVFDHGAQPDESHLSFRVVHSSNANEPLTKSGQ